MPLVWKLKTHRDERRNVENRQAIKEAIYHWMVYHSVPKTAITVGQDVIRNEIWLNLEPDYYYSLFALGWTGDQTYTLETFPEPRRSPPGWDERVNSTARIQNFRTS